MIRDSDSRVESQLTGGGAGRRVRCRGAVQDSRYARRDKDKWRDRNAPSVDDARDPAEDPQQDVDPKVGCEAALCGSDNDSEQRC